MKDFSEFNATVDSKNKQHNMTKYYYLWFFRLVKPVAETLHSLFVAILL